MKFDWTTSDDDQNVYHDAFTIRKNLTTPVIIPEYSMWESRTNTFAAYLVAPPETPGNWDWVKKVKVKLSARQGGVNWSGSINLKADGSLVEAPPTGSPIEAINLRGKNPYTNEFTEYTPITFINGVPEQDPENEPGYVTFYLSQTGGVEGHLKNEVMRVKQNWNWVERSQGSLFSTGEHNFYFVYDEINKDNGNTFVFGQFDETASDYEYYERFLPWADFLDIACYLADTTFAEEGSGEDRIVNRIEYKLHFNDSFSAEASLGFLFENLPFRRQFGNCTINYDDYTQSKQFFEYNFMDAYAVGGFSYSDQQIYDLTEAISRIRNADAHEAIYSSDLSGINLKTLVMLCADILGIGYQVGIDCRLTHGGNICTPGTLPSYAGEGNNVNQHLQNTLLIK